MNLKTHLHHLLQGGVQAVLGEDTPVNISIEYPEDPAHGDYASPIALSLAKKLNKSPLDVAEMLVEKMGKPDFLQTIEIAGPGFLNFFIKPEFLIGHLRGILKQGKEYGRNEGGAGKTILIEYSSPNTNKPLHLGHARNNALGMALANLLTANGYEVVKSQIINDRGIHICKSMAAYARYGRNTSPESVGKKGDHFVGEYYVKYTKTLEEDPSIEAEAQDMLRKWEQKDPDVRQLWATMNEWVLEGFNETYERIGSHFDEATFESDISEGGRAIIEKALAEGKLEQVEGGAIAMDLSPEGLGDQETGRKILIRSDGTTMYITQDLKLAVDRMESSLANKASERGPASGGLPDGGGDASPYKKSGLDQIIYVVGDEQDYHFKVLFAILKKLGYAWADKLVHLSYGMVDLPSGKMKSREGTAVDIDELLDELEQMVATELSNRNLEYTEKEKTEIVRKVALSALKYYLLKVDAKSRMKYDPASSIDFQGDTGPYLQYTYARMHSILRKGSVDEQLSNLTIDPLLLQESEALLLLRTLSRYPEVLEQAATDCKLHLICTYLFDLTKCANQFYEKHPVLHETSDQLRAARLQLIAGVAQVLKNGLNLLGIEEVERM